MRMPTTPKNEGELGDTTKAGFLSAPLDTNETISHRERLRNLLPDTSETAFEKWLSERRVID